MTLRKTHDEFVEEVNEAYPNEFIVLGEYVNRNKKVLVRHLECGEEFEIYPYDFVNKRYAKCKYCKSIEDLINAIEKSLIDNDMKDDYSYDILDARWQKDRIEVTHLTCGMKYNTSARSIVDGKKCPYCQGKRLNKEYAQYKIDNLIGSEKFKILNDDISNVNSRIKILHNECGRISDTSFMYFYYKSPQCHHCVKEKKLEKIRKSHNQFVDEVNEKYNGAYTVLTEYTTADNNVTIRHEYCGNELTFLGGRIVTGLFGCKYCNLNRPESTIYARLNKFDIKNEIQYTFDDCIGIHNRKLPFDFALFKDDKLVCLIEYDGRCHEEAIYGKEPFERTQRNDRLKNEYCKENNIRLHRIIESQVVDLNDSLDEILKLYNFI